MKIAYLSFGHIDVTIPLLQTLQKKYNHEIDYYILLCAKNPSESVLNLRNDGLSPDIYSLEKSGELLPDWFKKYLSSRINVRICLYPLNRLWSLKTHFFFLKLVKILSEKEYNILHISGISFYILHLLYSPFSRRTSKVITIHDLIPHSGEDTRMRRFLNIQKRVVNNFPVIVQNSYDYFKIAYTGEAHYIPFGILEFYKAIKPVKAIKSDILFFGRISPYKGISDLIEAFRILLTTNKKLRLCIAGEGSLETDFDDIKENLYLINQYISVEKLAGLIRSTKIVVCPYRDATQSAVLSTSHAFSKATIVTNVGGFKDVVSHNYNGLLVSPNDPESLAKNIDRLLDETFRLEIEKNICDFYQTGPFSWGTIAEKQNELYNQLVKDTE
jgi:glycosyltransferase involved in cell wall biosynthesis